MPNSRFDLTEIARSALNDLPQGKRAAFLAEMLTELRGPQALEHLSKARAAVNLRMQELIDEKFPPTLMSAQKRSDLENRIFFSPSPWREALRWLDESWRDGWDLPDDGEVFIGKVLIMASHLSGLRERSKK